MAWLIVLGIFLITAFATFGFFANIEDARREREIEEREAFLAAVGAGELSARLTEELRAIADSGESADQWLQRTRVPLGHCLLEEIEDCDKTTRCVQCDHFETTSADAPALQALLDQETELADRADGRGMKREAEIHRATAAAIERHLSQFDNLEVVG